MAKLKYDRPITVAIRSSSVINVPEGEVWKVSVYHNGSSPYEAPESLNVDSSTRIQIIGWPGKIGGAAYVTGIAFKHVED